MYFSFLEPQPIKKSLKPALYSIILSQNLIENIKHH